MDENTNTNEDININVESAPVEAPVNEEAPVEEPTPVVEEAPVTPSEPVMPTEPSATSAVPVQPVPQAEPIGVVPQPPRKKGSAVIFIIIVVILLLAIAGLAIGLIVIAAMGGKLGTSTTTTSTTTQQVESTKITVTTQETTTTIPRTTRGIDTPTPTSTDSQTIKVSNYELTIPIGYQEYKGSSNIPTVVNKEKKVQIGFYYNRTITFEKCINDPNYVIASIQKQGFDVTDATTAVKDTRKYMFLELSSASIPSGYRYIYAITEFNSGIMELAILLPETADFEPIAGDINKMLDSAKAGTSSFAPSVEDKDEPNADTFDALDERIFE